jgi:hypothetical protein
MPTSPESERPSSSIVGRERVCAFWGGFLFFIAILKIIPVPIENISLRVILKTRFTRTVILVVILVSFFIVPVPPVTSGVEVIRLLLWFVPRCSAMREKEMTVSTLRTVVHFVKIMSGPRFTR